MQSKQTESKYQSEEVFKALLPYLKNPSAFHPGWEDGSGFLQSIKDCPILVVGAGGLGCELVKNLALSGVRKIHLIDMDTIDFTNLNRQFLFRVADVGTYKAEAVAKFIQKRCPGVQVIPHTKRVQDMFFSFYQQFPIIIGGLDNVEARKYLNSIIFQINRDEEQTQCYYIDGATQGFEGQALLVDPYKTSCYECSLLGLKAAPKVNYCTLANTPRTPQHCIQYVLELLWSKEREHQLRDNDNLEHMQWVYQKSLQRAKEFKIEGVTEMLTLGVTKNIIPAIASTNAFVAAACTNEAMKILSGIHPKLNNYLLYLGGTSVGTRTYPNQKLQNCRACLMRVNKLEKLCIGVSDQETIENLFQKIKVHYEHVRRAFVNNNGNIFLNPGERDIYTEKLTKTFSKLIAQGQLEQKNPILFYLTDKSLKDELKVEVTVNKGGVTFNEAVPV